MWKNYLKIAWRNLLKKKVYSFINITGLGIGMACCVLIFMFVRNELSYDNYHEKKDRIFRVVHGSLPPDGSNPDLGSFWVWGNAPIGAALKNDFPEIDQIVQFSGRSDILLTYEDHIFQEEGVFFMDSTVFDVFSWELTRGNPKTALSAPFSIVLTESTARKYFGNEDPLGKTLKGSKSSGRADAGDYTVTGIMPDLPSNSHFRFNVLLSLSTFHQSRPEVFDARSWDYVDFYTYFLVNDRFDQAAFEQKIPGFVDRRRGQDDYKYTFVIEPLKDVYLRTSAQRQPGETGNLSNIYIFSIIRLFILAIAMINFMNLSTARSMERAKEVGRQYGYANPADIVGKKFDQWGWSGEVIGVVKDFNYFSLHRAIEPLTLPFRPYESRYLSLKVTPDNHLSQTIAEVEQVWKELAPHRPFLYSFLDEDFDRQYQSDLRFRKIFTTFSVLAILIACLGLLGLATYTAEQRTKEIGIRKVLGAKVSSIVALLSKDFIKLVLIAMVIATPVSWYAMNRWLGGFAYKIEVSWWIYPLAGIMAIAVALLTISFQSVKAALMNPVDSLKSE